jgi:hypothetical protein
MGLRPTQVDEKRLRSSNCFPWSRRPFLCHPERTRISYFTALNSANYVVLPKENHMQLTEAPTPDRKSGGAEGSAVSLNPKRRSAREGYEFRLDTRRVPQVSLLRPGIPLGKAHCGPT